MKYFELLLNRDPQVSGIETGTDQAYFTNKFWRSHKQLRDFMFGNDTTNYMAGLPPSWKIDLIGLELDDLANLTDFVSVGALLRGFVVSQKVKNILEEYCLPEHKFYEVIFKRPSDKGHFIKGYWWFYFEVETGVDNISFDKSIFNYSLHEKTYPGVNFSINTFKDYQSIFDKTPPAPIASKLVLKPSFDRKLDIWGTRFLTAKKYISDKLLSKFQEEGVTGFRTRDLGGELVFE